MVELGDGRDGFVLGIEFGKNRYAIERVKDGVRTLVAGKRAPRRPDQAYRLRVDVTDDRVVLQSESGDLIEAPRGGLQIKSAVLLATGSFAIATSSRASRSRIAADSPGGANTASHEVCSTPGTPASAIVGTLGNSFSRCRLLHR